MAEAGLAEQAEQRARKRLLGQAVLGMPLHAYDKARAGQAHRLDLTVGRRCYDHEARRQPVDPWLMQGIDHEARAAGEPVEQPALGQGYGMRVVGVALVERQPAPRAVIKPPRQLVQALMQAAAERD